MLNRPPTPRHDVTEIIGNVLFDDPYRWLEEENAETLTWQARQNEYTDRILRRIEILPSLTGKIERLTRPLGISAPRQRAGMWYRVERDETGSRLVISAEIGAPGTRIILTRGDSRREAPHRVDWWRPSPDGRHVAFGISEGGGAQGGIQLSEVRVVDTIEGIVLGQRIRHVVYGAIAWLPDSSGFYYVAGLDFADRNAERRVFLHRIGEPGPDRMESLHGLSYCTPQLSPDGRYLVLVRGSREPRADLILDRESGAGWRTFLHDVPAACFGCFDGDRYLAITTLGAERGRVVSIPLETASDPSTWREIVPQSEAVLRDIALVDGHIVLGELVDGAARIRIVKRDGEPCATVPMPAQGTANCDASFTWWHYVGYPMFTAGETGIAFVCSSFGRAPVIVAYDVREKRLVHCGEAETVLDGLQVEMVHAPAGDGASIPVRLIRGGGDTVTGPRPMVIFAYGGYNHAFTPAWLAMFAAMIDHGVGIAFSHIRGGGEFGGDWWRAGHHERKQRSFDDIYAVAEWLISTGRTTAGRLGIVGASNGGLNVSAAATQRPELFRAAVALVPQCDLLRYSRDLFYGGKPIEGHHNGVHIHGGTWRGGGPEGPAGGNADERPIFPQSVYPDPFGYSPYHNVKPGRTYPALLVVSSDRDLWCPPWHGRKFVARLQENDASGRPVLLRVWHGDGHDVPILGRADQIAEWVAFLITELTQDSRSVSNLIGIV